MIEALLRARSERLRYYHVRLNYSDDMDAMGKFAWRKVGILFTVIFKVLYARVRHATPMLYYPPSGPNMVPVLRDIIFLCATRWAFRWTVFHFHAGGVSSFGPQLPATLRPFFKLAYRHSDLAIRTAPQNPDDGQLLMARREVVVPNGIPDMRGTVPERRATGTHAPVILFTGVLIPSKGVMILLQAFAMVMHRGVRARLELMGSWGNELFKQECLEFIETNGIEEHVQFLGVKQGLEKFEHFAGCDLFCFPSFFEAESFGLVLLEAMQFAKPVIATRWRGIPSVVEEGVNGSLVAVRDVAGLADRLVELLGDEELRRKMGEEGRRIFVDRFTLNGFHHKMEEVLLSVPPKKKLGS